MFLLKILKYTRPLNLLVMWLTVALLYFFVMPKSADGYEFCGLLNFFYLSIPVIFIGAAGYLLNDFYDYDIDKINKKDTVLLRDQFTSLEIVWAYAIYNLIGLLVSFYLGENTFWLSLSNVVFLILYAHWKRVFLIGNIAVAYLCSSVILWVWVFAVERDPEFNFEKIKYYLIFSFLLSLAREIIKDIEDMEGDYIQGCRTMPIVLGTKAVKNLILLLLGLLGYFLFEFGYSSSNYKSIYLLLLVIIPLVFIGIKLVKGTTKSDFSHLSKWCKIIMVTGLGSMILP